MKAPSELSCKDLDQSTLEDEQRVGTFADAKPGCGCETESLSEYSPGLITDDEVIARVVCTPMHVHRKHPKLMASFFSKAMSQGASVQRLDHATDAELAKCVEDLIAGGSDRVWLGYVVASAGAIRALQLRQADEQSFCVVDAALPRNPAHAEIHCAYRVIEDADQIEHRHRLLEVFSTNSINHRKGLRAGSVWDLLPKGLQDRALPQQWEQLA